MPSKARPKSMLSFTHRKSSSGSHVKVENLTETAEEKASHRFTSKADPSKAINEAQPDLADGNNLQSKRNSYYQGNDAYPTLVLLCNLADSDNPSGQRPQQRHWAEASSGYYNNRTSVARPDSYIDGYGGNPSQLAYGRRVNQRVNSDPTLYGSNAAPNVYPTHGYHQSYDTVASGSGNESHNTDPWGNTTDPSSENSSIDRVQQAPKSDLAETYGFNGFGGVPQFPGPILEDHAMDGSSYGNPSAYGQPQKAMNGFSAHNKTTLPPTPPPHVLPKQNPPRVPIKLGNSPVKDRSSSQPNGEKRKSWLKRRFSRS
ncbi:MAG: hypothetical protein Q9218_000920 [Villophora microphyllina]